MEDVPRGDGRAGRLLTRFSPRCASRPPIPPWGVGGRARCAGRGPASLVRRLPRECRRRIRARGGGAAVWGPLWRRGCRGPLAVGARWLPADLRDSPGRRSVEAVAACSPLKLAGRPLTFAIRRGADAAGLPRSAPPELAGRPLTSARAAAEAQRPDASFRVRRSATPRVPVHTRSAPPPSQVKRAQAAPTRRFDCAERPLARPPVHLHPLSEPTPPSGRLDAPVRRAGARRAGHVVGGRSPRLPAAEEAFVTRSADQGSPNAVIHATG